LHDCSTIDFQGRNHHCPRCCSLTSRRASQDQRALPTTASAVARLPVPLTFLFAPVVGEVLADLAIECSTRHDIAFLAMSRVLEQTVA
jgi:hypothetical protein